MRRRGAASDVAATCRWDSTVFMCSPLSAQQRVRITARLEAGTTQDRGPPEGGHYSGPRPD